MKDVTNIYNNKVTLNWYKATNENGGYEIYKKLSSNSTYSLETTVGPGVLTADITGLSGNTSYTFYVRAVRLCAVNEDIVEAYRNSNTITALTKPNTPTTKLASGIESDKFTANWYAASGTGSVTYGLVVADASLVTQGTYTLISGTSYEVNSLALAPATTYYYKVRAVNSSGASGYSSWRSVFTLPSTPVADAAGPVGQTSFTANWNATADATSYELDVATDANFVAGSYLLQTAGLTLASYDLTGLSAGEKYYYRVRGVNSSAKSKNSNVMEVLMIPPDISSITVTDIGQNSFILSWDKAKEATTYNLDVAIDNSFSNIIFTDNTIEQPGTGITEVTRSVTGLASGTPHYVRISAINYSGESGYTNAVALTKPANPLAATPSSITQDSFLAKWTAVTGASDYELDVSDDLNFENIVYQNLSTGNIFSETINGLAAGKNYYYRVRAINESGTSGDSNTVTTITIPAEPVSVNFSNIGQNGFNVQWPFVEGAAGYELDASTSSDFSSDITNLLVMASGEVEELGTFSGMAPGTEFYLRIRSLNESGNSAYAIFSDNPVLTSPDNPVAANANSIQQTSFTANWQPVPSAVGYLLTVSRDIDFNSTLSEYTDKIVTSTSHMVEGLDPGVRYYYRVVAQNLSGNSRNSNAVSTITIPKPPAITEFSEHTSVSFKVSWQNDAVGVDNYLLYVATDENFTELLPQYGPKTISGNFLETYVNQDLLPNKIYYIKLEAANESGASTSSQIRITSTLNADGTVNSPEVAEPVYTKETNIMSFSVSGGVGGIKDVLFLYKGVAAQEYDTLTLLVENNEHNVEIPQDAFDEFGLEYIIIARDMAEWEVKKDDKIRATIENVKIPLTNFGRDISNYRMISIPYDLASNRIEDNIIKAVGAPDKAKWRFMHYRNGAYVYYDALAVENFVKQNAYWFISVDTVELSFGEGLAPDYDLSNPFIMKLKKGWNQVGSPYPFDLNWSQVLSYNGSPEGVGGLMVYDAENLSFIESDILPKFGGGFVFSENDQVILTIPVDIRNNNSGGNGGRLSNTKLESEEIGSDRWFLPLELSVGKMKSRIGGVGMSIDASDGGDRLDMVSMPRFLKYLEFIVEHPDHFARYFTRDIVTAKPLHHWDVKVEHNYGNGPVSIEWDSDRILKSGVTLLLQDKEAGVLIDMSATGSYTFSDPSRELKIIYSEVKSDIGATKIQFGMAYPNPASESVFIPVQFILGDDASKIQVLVYDQKGVCVYHEQVVSREPGLFEYNWDTRNISGDPVPDGLYHYQVIDQTNSKSWNGKVIISR
ncbi:Fibronectin, type III domain protein [Fulvivirga imtechensis AK7]|uniref:Fibronectin, type III domain protein n=2 Tax=Fulvivirga TaxID=396811 RepID=L8JMV6_9BACT|nr:Fibronectin, type III domain protein [Fulvivirga imtechensis AK7]